VACWGLYTAAEFALIARRHMHLYGTRPEALAEGAATIRNHGARHPDAVFYGRRVTREDVLASRMVADPYHLLDCAINSEGARGSCSTPPRAPPVSGPGGWPTPYPRLAGATTPGGARDSCSPPPSAPPISASSRSSCSAARS